MSDKVTGDSVDELSSILSAVDIADSIIDGGTISDTSASIAGASDGDTFWSEIISGFDGSIGIGFDSVSNVSVVLDGDNSSLFAEPVVSDEIWFSKVMGSDELLASCEMAGSGVLLASSVVMGSGELLASWEMASSGELLVSCVVMGSGELLGSCEIICSVELLGISVLLDTDAIDSIVGAIVDEIVVSGNVSGAVIDVILFTIITSATVELSFTVDATVVVFNATASVVFNKSDDAVELISGKFDVVADIVSIVSFGSIEIDTAGKTEISKTGDGDKIGAGVCGPGRGTSGITDVACDRLGTGPLNSEFGIITLGFGRNEFTGGRYGAAGTNTGSCRGNTGGWPYGGNIIFGGGR